MNRKQRRAAKAGNKQKVKVTAFHEAGHAVARYLTADEMGFAVEDCIKSITVSAGLGPSMGNSHDGHAELYSQAVTYGPMLSQEIGEVMSDMGMSKAPGTEMSGLEAKDFLTEVVSSARERGANISSWLNARALIAVFGACAEASMTRQSANDVWNSYECEDDLNGIIQDGVVAGLSADDIEALISSAFRRAAECMQRQEVRKAIDQLAKAIHRGGSMEGTQAVQIIRKTMEA